MAKKGYSPLISGFKPVYSYETNKAQEVYQGRDNSNLPSDVDNVPVLKDLYDKQEAQAQAQPQAPVRSSYNPLELMKRMREQQKGVAVTVKPGAIEQPEQSMLDQFYGRRNELKEGETPSFGNFNFPLNLNNIDPSKQDNTFRNTILANEAHMGDFKTLEQQLPEPPIQTPEAISVGNFKTLEQQQPKSTPGQWANKNVYSGLTGLQNSLYSTLDLFLPNELLGKYDFIEPLFEYTRNVNTNAQRTAEAVNDTKAKQIAGTLTQATIQAVPDALLAIYTGGGSLLGKGLVEGANSASKIGKVGASLQAIAKEHAGNPMFWTSFMQIAGPTYEQEKAQGASEIRAQASGLINGLLGSAIEVGSGLEKFSWGDKGLHSILKTMAEEGLEEMKQYSVQNLTNKAVGSNTAKVFSLDPNQAAVLNPGAQIEQGLYGAAVGGILGGGQQAIVAGINKSNEKKQAKDTEMFEAVGMEPDYTGDGIANMNTALFEKSEAVRKTVMDVSEGTEPDETTITELKQARDIFQKASKNRLVVESAKKYYEEMTRQIDNIIKTKGTKPVQNPTAPQEAAAAHNLPKRTRGSNVYFHTSYVDSSPYAETVKTAAQKANVDLGDQNIVVSVNNKDGSVTFTQVDSFNDREEPSIQQTIKVSANGTVNVNPVNGQRKLVDKANFVTEEYTGFDVAQAKEREKVWRKLPNNGKLYSPDAVDTDGYFDSATFDKHIEGSDLGHKAKPEEPKQEAQEQEQKEYVLWGATDDEPEYEELISAEIKTTKELEEAKKWAADNGYTNVRVSEYTPGETPDFGGAVMNTEPKEEPKAEAEAEQTTQEPERPQEPKAEPNKEEPKRENNVYDSTPIHESKTFDDVFKKEILRTDIDDYWAANRREGIYNYFQAHEDIKDRVKYIKKEMYFDNFNRGVNVEQTSKGITISIYRRAKKDYETQSYTWEQVAEKFADIFLHDGQYRRSDREATKAEVEFKAIIKNLQNAGYHFSNSFFPPILGLGSRERLGSSWENRYPNLGIEKYFSGMSENKTYQIKKIAETLNLSFHNHRSLVLGMDMDKSGMSAEQRQDEIYKNNVKSNPKGARGPAEEKAEYDLAIKNGGLVYDSEQEIMDTWRKLEKMLLDVAEGKQIAAEIEDTPEKIELAKNEGGGFPEKIVDFFANTYNQVERIKFLKEDYGLENATWKEVNEIQKEVDKEVYFHKIVEFTDDKGKEHMGIVQEIKDGKAKIYVDKLDYHLSFLKPGGRKEGPYKVENNYDIYNIALKNIRNPAPISQEQWDKYTILEDRFKDESKDNRYPLIEELAELSGKTVDEVRYFQIERIKKGLLDYLKRGLDIHNPDFRYNENLVTGMPYGHMYSARKMYEKLEDITMGRTPEKKGAKKKETAPQEITAQEPEKARSTGPSQAQGGMTREEIKNLSDDEFSKLFDKMAEDVRNTVPNKYFPRVGNQYEFIRSAMRNGKWQPAFTDILHAVDALVNYDMAFEVEILFDHLRRREWDSVYRDLISKYDDGEIGKKTNTPKQPKSEEPEAPKELEATPSDHYEEGDTVQFYNSKGQKLTGTFKKYAHGGTAYIEAEGADGKIGKYWPSVDKIIGKVETKKEEPKAEEAPAPSEIKDETLPESYTIYDAIHHVIRMGTGKPGGKQRIFDHVTQNPGEYFEKFIPFLKQEYGTGEQVSPERPFISEKHDENGITITVKTQKGTETRFEPWWNIAQTIQQEIEMGDFSMSGEKVGYANATKNADWVKPSSIKQFKELLTEGTEFSLKRGNETRRRIVSHVQSGNSIKFIDGNHREAWLTFTAKEIEFTDFGFICHDSVQGNLVYTYVGGPLNVKEAQKKELENAPEITDNEGEKGGTDNETSISGISEGISGGTEPQVLQGTGKNGQTGGLSQPTERLGGGNTQPHEGKENDKGDERTGLPGGISGENTNSEPGGNADRGRNPGSVGTASKGYRITEDTDLGKTGKVQRFDNNVAAIEFLNTLEEEGRNPTEEEMEVLAKFSGWGGIKEAFIDNKEPAWQRRAEEIKNLLTRDQYRAAALSTENAFYTPFSVIKSMYDIVKAVGVKDKAAILEPSCGSGYFIGCMPNNMRNSSKITGVELDDITGKIAKYLYPDANINVQGFEDTAIPKNSLDLIIGNIPFGDLKAPYDKEYKQYGKYLIHDYFLLKGLDSLKEGGIMAVITTSGTLDKRDSEVRELMDEKANLVSAVRFPSGTFTATGVVADLLIFQKKGENVKTPGNDFIKVKDLEARDSVLGINEYFLKHPAMVLGDVDVTTNQYGEEVLTVKGNGRTLADVLDYIPKNIVVDVTEAKSETMANEVTYDVLDRGEAAADQTFIVKGDKIYKKNSLTGEHEEWYKIYKSGERAGQKELISPDSMAAQRVRAMIDLHRLFKKVLDVQKATEDEAPLKKAQEELTKAYDVFVKKFGAVNDDSNKYVFKDDPRYYHLCTIEKKEYVKGGKNGVAYSKGNTFTERVIPIEKPITSVDNVDDALVVSLNIAGGVNLDYMAKLYGKDKSTIVRELGQKIYELPDDSGTYVLGEEYLSGNVKEKLKAAKKKAETDSRFAVNVEALEKVIPADLTADQIAVEIGSPWVGTRYITDFINSLYENKAVGIKVAYSSYSSTWSVEMGSAPRSAVDMANVKWGTTGYMPYELVYALLNKKPIVVRFSDSSGQSFIDDEATRMARAKADELIEYFNDWIFKDANRREYLVNYYNEHFNNLVPRKFDGSYLKMYGVNPEIKLKPHQKSAVARSIAGLANVLFAHPVGAGKTFAMIGSVMEMKRLGIAQKPIMVVPNHKIGDFMADFYRMYPNANILAVKDDDFSATNRKKLLAKIQDTNFDCVIMRHSSFGMFPFSPEYQQEYIQNQIIELEDAIRRAKADNMSKRDLKSMNTRLKNLKDSLKEALDMHREVTDVFFDTCGIDSLIVDEAHNFKNLSFPTKMTRIAGVQNSGSKRSTNMHMATEAMNGRGKKIIFATATPISNSIGELYTMMRYLEPEVLREYGIDSFDAWADTFGRVISKPEMNTTGSGLTSKERFSKFRNVPELIKIFKVVADIVNKDSLDIVLPEAEYRHIKVESSAILKRYNQDIELHKRNMSVEEAKKGGHLVLMQDARHAALDLRCVRKIMIERGVIRPDVSNEDLDFPGSKINTAVQNIVEEYNNTTDIPGTQLVFLDRGTPQNFTKKELEEIQKLRSMNPDELSEEQLERLAQFDNAKRYGFDLYEDIRKKLIASGVKPEEIAFIQDNRTDEKKKKLFDKVNAGEIRILLGSTAMMGEGMNVQKRVVALHQLDAPMRPSDVEQRNGRALRQFNDNKNIRLYNYSTLNSYDAPTWEMLSRKNKAVNQMMLGDESQREMEDLGDDMFSDMSVEAANNPKMFERKDLEEKYNKLKYKKRNFQKERTYNQDVVKNHPGLISRIKAVIKEGEHLQKRYEEAPKEEFEVSGEKYDSMKEASIALEKAVKNLKDTNDTIFCQIRGFNVSVKKSLDNFSYACEFMSKSQWYLSDNVRAFMKDKNDSSDEEIIGFAKPETVFLRLNNKLQEIAPDIKAYEQQLEDAEKKLEFAKQHTDDDFPQEAELVRTKQRLDEIDQELRAGGAQAQPQGQTPSNPTDEIREEIERQRRLNQSPIRASVSLPAQDKSITGTMFVPTKEYTPKNNLVVFKSTKGELKSPGEITRKLSRDFGVPVTSTRFRRRGKLGVYNTKYKQIETKYYNTIGVVSHELGHFLDQKYNLSEKYKDEVEEMANRLPDEFRKRYKQEELPGEAIADFVKLYLTDPLYGVYEFGELSGGRNFVDIFNDALDAKDKKMLTESVSDIMTWLSADTQTKIKKSIIRYDGKHPKLEKIYHAIFTKDGRYRLYTEHINLQEGFKTLDDYIENRTGKKLAASERAELKAFQTMRSDVIVNFIAMGKLVTPEGEIIGEGFKSIIDKVKKGDLEDMDAYLKITHAIDWLEQGKLVFSPDITFEDLKLAKKAYDEQFPYFADVAENLYDWWDTFCQTWLVDTGLMEQTTYDMLRELYPHYVPNFRVSDTSDKVEFGVKRAQSGFSNIHTPMRRASEKGNDMDTYSATQSMVLEIERYVKTVMRRDVLLTLHKNYNNEDYAEAMGMFMRRVGPEEQKNVYDAMPLKGDLIWNLFQEELKSRPQKEQDEYKNMTTREQLNLLKEWGKADLVNRIIDDYIVYFTPKKISTDNRIVTVEDNGHTYFYEILDTEGLGEYLLTALENVDPKQLDGWVKMIAKARRIVTVLTTGGNPFFGVTSNFWRDIQQSYILGSYNNPVTFAREIFKAFRSIAQQDDFYLKYKAIGGGHESPIGADVDYIKKTMRKIAPEEYKGAGNRIGWAISKLEDFNNLIETAPRLVEFKYWYERGGDTYDSLLQAGFKAADVTLNFSRHGSWTTLAQVIPFFNAGVQGLDKLYRAGVKDKKEFKARFVKALTLISLFSVIQALAYADDDDYEKVPDFFKDNYWLIKYDHENGEGKFIRIPKPREMGVLFGATFERAVWAMLHSEDDNGKALMMAFAQNFSVPIRWVFAPLYDVIANKQWSGSPIVPSSEEESSRPGYYMDQYDDTTSLLAVGLGMGMNWLHLDTPMGAFASPRNIDYLLKQYSGILGQVALPPITPSTEGIAGLASGFTRRVTVDTTYSNKYVDEFYDIWSTLEASKSRHDEHGKTDKNYNEEWRKTFQRNSNGAKKTNIIGLSEYWKQIKEINNNDNLSFKEKQAQTEAIRHKINEQAERIVKEYHAATGQ